MSASRNRGLRTIAGLAFSLLLASGGAAAAEETKPAEEKIRPAALAGSWYPAPQCLVHAEIDQQHAAAALARGESGHEPRSARTQHDDVMIDHAGCAGDARAARQASCRSLSTSMTACQSVSEALRSTVR